MIKKIIVLCTGALLSMSASASYVRYNFSGDLYGFFVENVESKMVVDYNIFAPNVALYQPSGNIGVPYNQRSDFCQVFGPTGFSITDMRGRDAIYELTIDFDGMYSTTPNSFSAYYSVAQGPDYPSGPRIPPFVPKKGVLHGSVGESAVSLEDSAYYDRYAQDVISRETPSQGVPEPASLALIAVGALCAAGVARRRNRAA